MYTNYSKLKYIAEKEFNDIVTATAFVGGKASAPNKLRIYLIDTSFPDVWLSVDGDYCIERPCRQFTGGATGFP